MEEAMAPVVRRFRTQSRAVTVALCTVLALLAGLSVLQAVVGGRATARLERSGDLVEAYLLINRAVSDKDAIEDSYIERPSARAREDFRAAGERLRAALDTLEEEGAADDRLLAGRIARTSQRYSAAMEYLFRAVAAGDTRLAEEIDDTQLDVHGGALGTLVSRSGPEHATEALHEVDELRRRQRSLLALTVVALPVGLLVVVVLGWTLRSLRRRLDLAQAHELAQLERFAHTDSLTGIGNHRAFDEMLHREVARTARSGSPLALIMLDVDGLKAINDAGGHQAGDRMIKSVAAALAAAARASDGVFRIGGDEYAAILPDTTAWGAYEVARRVHAAVGGEGISVSAGIAVAERDMQPDDLVAAADAALFTAKGEGSDTVIHEDGMGHRGQAADAGEERHRATLASALARAVDARDSWTRSHCETVAELSGLTAAGLGLDAEHVADVRLAGLVHDVGKIGVPDAILQKPARLTAEEYEIVKGHSALGHRILEGTALAGVAPWVLHHHERVDGGGYPAGLAGEQIPLESRILHVADAFEAMTSDRPYRDGMSEEDALDELHRHAGTQFDVACVEALSAAVRRPAQV
jgi:diguanylate cyclase (GGDEF)-like protein